MRTVNTIQQSLPAMPFAASRARGSIMILTIGVVIFLTGLALVFSRQMRAEALASQNQLEAVQADAIVRGAAQHVLNRLSTNTDQSTLDTEIQSEAVALGDGQFWLLRPNPDDERQYAYGVADEASKLNINTATEDMLLALPGMTQELASAIVDWREAEDTSADSGGESSYYLQLPEPYYSKSAPFETLDELLLVKGATRDLLYGVDSNRNGVVDENEQTGVSTLSGLNGQMECGLCKYLTVYSSEPNRSQSGTARLFVGDNRASTLAQVASLLRRSMTAERAATAVARLRAAPAAANVLDFYFKSGLTMDEFKRIADLITTDRAAVLVGRINVNTAPKEVLRCLPDIEDSDIDQIIAARQANGPDLSSIAWIAQTLPPAKAAKIGGLITVHSSQYSADIVGVCANGRGFKRCKYVFDLRYTPIRIVYRKDFTNLGWPLSAATLDTLRSGGLVQSSSGFSLGRQ